MINVTFSSNFQFSMFHQINQPIIKQDELRDLAKNLAISDVKFLNSSKRQFTELLKMSFPGENEVFSISPFSLNWRFAFATKLAFCAKRNTRRNRWHFQPVVSVNFAI